jgi:ribosomal protein L13E
MHHIKALITKQNGKQSTGRGFSLTELAKAGLNKQQAKQMCIPLDVKRKSAHEENIQTLRVHAEKVKALGQSKKEASKTEPTEKPKKKAKS